jgi:hypothetical protein
LRQSLDTNPTRSRLGEETYDEPIQPGTS